VIVVGGIITPFPTAGPRVPKPLDPQQLIVASDRNPQLKSSPPPRAVTPDNTVLLGAVVVIGAVVVVVVAAGAVVVVVAGAVVVVVAGAVVVVDAVEVDPSDGSDGVQPSKLTATTKPTPHTRTRSLPTLFPTFHAPRPHSTAFRHNHRNAVGPALHGFGRM